MSLLIKGVEMPEKNAIILFVYPNGSTVYIKENSEIILDDHIKAVEIPPHGRLIDADALMRDIQEHDYLVRDEYDSIGNGMFTCGIQYAITKVAPTIIEAEEKE